MGRGEEFSCKGEPAAEYVCSMSAEPADITFHLSECTDLDYTPECESLPVDNCTFYKTIDNSTAAYVNGEYLDSPTTKCVVDGLQCVAGSRLSCWASVPSVSEDYLFLGAATAQAFVEEEEETCGGDEGGSRRRLSEAPPGKASARRLSSNNKLSLKKKSKFLNMIKKIGA